PAGGLRLAQRPRLLPQRALGRLPGDGPPLRRGGGHRPAMSRALATMPTERPARFPELTVETPRLLVRPLVAADAAGVAAVFDDRLTRRWMSLPAPYTEAHARDWCTRLAAERRERG